MILLLDKATPVKYWLCLLWNIC